LRLKGLDAVTLDGGAVAWGEKVLAEGASSSVAGSYRMMVNGGSPILDGVAPPPIRKKNVTPPTRKGKKTAGCS